MVERFEEGVCGNGDYKESDENGCDKGHEE